MGKMSLKFLSTVELQRIHDTSIKILRDVGIKVPSGEACSYLEGKAGITVDDVTKVIRFTEDAVLDAVRMTPSSFSVYGRDRTRKVSYGKQDGFVCQAIPGEAQWVDPIKNTRREGTLENFNKCVVVADALPNIDIVGAMIQPAEIPVEIRDVFLYAELLKRTTKTVRSWVYNRKSARYILEMLRILSGGEDDLRTYPIAEFGFEPISPLQFPEGPLETAIEFAQAGIPITVGPMPQAMATGPVTLAGSLAQGNAEALGALTILQAVAPGVPVIYYNAPHIMDPKTMSLVFSSPEQGLLGLGVTELGKFYDLPVGVNVGMTDAKVPDAQSGLEKGMTLLLGALAGADIFGAMGISGCDQGFSLPQLIIDDEIIGFVKRILKGILVDESTLAFEVIKKIGIGGTFLMEDHTLTNWRNEFWIPKICDRGQWDTWIEKGGKTMVERAADRQEQILATHHLDWLDEDVQEELDEVIEAARRGLLDP